MFDKELFSEEIGLGDSKVFERIFKLHYTSLTLFANRFLNDLSLSEEIVSETFTFLWEKRSDIRVTSSVKAYLYKMVQNRSLNYIKHKKIENEYVSYLIRNNLLTAYTYGGGGECDERELEDQIYKAIENLPDKCKRIFKMSRFDHLKNKEIAVKLNLSPKTVERQITIALEKLRNSIRYLLILFFVFLLVF